MSVGPSLGAGRAALPEYLWQPARNGSATTFLLLHGTGGDERSLLRVAAAIDGEAGVLAVRGAVLEGTTRRHFRRIPGGDNPGYPFTLDLEDLRARADVYADLVHAAAAEHGFEPAGVVAFGFSNGANMAAGLLLHRPDALGAAILASPNCPWEDGGRVLPRQLAQGVGALIVAGREDPIGRPQEAERLAALLADCGAAVDLRWHPGGHELPAPVLPDVTAWLATWQAGTGRTPLPQG